MAEVYPLYNANDVTAIKNILTETGHVREAEGFFLACHIGLRAGDLLKITFKQMAEKFVEVDEDKTGKTRRFPVTDVMKVSLKQLKK